MKSNRKIKQQTQKKTNKKIAEIIAVASKNKFWRKVAEILAGPRKKMINLNIGEIENKTNDGEKVVIPGKVLSQGETNTKIKIVALNFSERAMEKLKNANCEFSTIEEEIKKNPDGKDLKILK